MAVPATAGPSAADAKAVPVTRVPYHLRVRSLAITRVKRVASALLRQRYEAVLGGRLSPSKHFPKLGRFEKASFFPEEC